MGHMTYMGHTVAQGVTQEQEAPLEATLQGLQDFQSVQGVLPKTLKPKSYTLHPKP